MQFDPQTGEERMFREVLSRAERPTFGLGEPERVARLGWCSLNGGGRNIWMEYQEGQSPWQYRRQRIKLEKGRRTDETVFYALQARKEGKVLAEIRIDATKGSVSTYLEVTLFEEGITVEEREGTFRVSDGSD